MLGLSPGAPYSRSSATRELRRNVQHRLIGVPSAGAASDSGPERWRNGVAYMFLVAVVLIMVGELADKSQSSPAARDALQGVAGTRRHLHRHVRRPLLHDARRSVPRGLDSARRHPWITGILFIGFGIWTLRGDKVEDERGRQGRRVRADPRDHDRVLLRRAGRQDADHDVGHRGRPGPAHARLSQGRGPDGPGLDRAR